jgi:UPF0716 protein FxsA
MSSLSRLFLLFVGVPLLELFVLIQLGQLVGLWPTIGLVVLTGFAGAALARLEGLRTIWKIRGQLARGQLPGDALLDGLAILLGGALLLTPGVLTDLVGFSFLLPPTRRRLMGRIRQSLERRVKAGAIRITTFNTGAGGMPFGQAPFPWGGSGEEDPTRPPSSGEIVVEPEDSDGPG